MTTIINQLRCLENWFHDKSGTITAFSGGIDSTLVLYVSHRQLGARGIGCISISPSLKRRDYAFAIDFCHENNIPLEVVETAELYDENYFLNPAGRCYTCKSHLYDTMSSVQEKYPGYALLNGTNIDDLGDYRPGLEAARKAGISSPLLDCQINKEGVRKLAKYFGLPNWDKPASPCLSSRIPYGDVITAGKLKKIELAEAHLNDLGFEDVRVRCYGNMASIEVPVSDMGRLRSLKEVWSLHLKGLGFEDSHIDAEGFVSGKLNRSLQASFDEGVSN